MKRRLSKQFQKKAHLQEYAMIVSVCHSSLADQHFCKAVRSHFQSKRLGGSTNKRLETAKSPKETTGAAKESFSTRIGEKKPAAPRSSVRRPRAALS